MKTVTVKNDEGVTITVMNSRIDADKALIIISYDEPNVIEDINARKRTRIFSAEIRLNKEESMCIRNALTSFIEEG